jgi:plastocyanin domain-containing protein
MLCRSLLPARRDSRTIALAALLSLGTAAAFGTAGCNKSEAAAPLADVTASEHGFSPSSLKLPSGGPGSHASVSFVRTTDQTCATEVVFPDLGINQKLPLNQPVKIDVPTDAAKTLTFQCGMGMYKGSVVVTEKK